MTEPGQSPNVPMLSVATDNPTPPYEQLRLQLVELIVSGALAAGQRLPPLRQLAGDLGLAVGTVARAYRELEAAGLVRSRRGGGTRVADPLPVVASDRSAQLINDHAAELVRKARLLGADDQSILDAVVAACAQRPAAGIAGAIAR